MATIIDIWIYLHLMLHAIYKYEAYTHKIQTIYIALYSPFLSKGHVLSIFLGHKLFYENMGFRWLPENLNIIFFLIEV